MSVVTESVDVELPVRAVYDQWTQFEEFPQFMEGVDSVVQQGDDHTHWRVSIGGVRREFDAVILEQVPDRRVSWASVNGPRHAGIVTFAQQGEHRTTVTAQMDIEPEGLAEKAGDALGLISRRVQGDLERFKTFIERRGEATGGWRGQIG
ncbi:SRPBCC family protein [Longispora albida]|uniref:SRPBCC family protein n=1 Tax=Longispora albida TaxID=203523 RepID=UPI0003742039|nr:SRPBCC family protein [Longispora albida]